MELFKSAANILNAEGLQHACDSAIFLSVGYPYPLTQLIREGDLAHMDLLVFFLGSTADIGT